MPHFYPFIYQWILRLPPYLGYCKQYCSEHRGQFFILMSERPSYIIWSKISYNLVLKWRFYYFSGIVRPNRPWDGCHRKESLLHTVPSERGTQCQAAPHETAPASVWRQRESKGKTRAKPLLWFLQKETGKAKWTGLRLTHLNNFCSFWRMGTVPSCLGPGPEVIKTGGLWPKVWEPDERGAWNWDWSPSLALEIG